MTTPLAFDSTLLPYKYIELTGLVDVETGGVGMITQVRTFAALLGWTEVSTALFKTLVDTAGRWYDVLMTRISAGIMEFRVRDSSGHTIMTRRIGVNTTSGSAVRVYMAGGNANTSAAGAYLIVESVQGNVTAYEVFCSYMLDPQPAALGDLSLYVIANATLSGSSSSDGNFANVYQWFAFDNGAASVQNRLRQRDYSLNAVLAQTFQSGVGRFRHYEAQVWINFAGNIRWAGRMPHTLCVDSTIGYGCRRRPSLDTNLRGTYQVLTGLATGVRTRLAVRVGD